MAEEAPRALRAARRERGRPCKLTAEIQKQLCDCISVGSYYLAACAYVGISYSTFREWMKRGQDARRGPYREFFDAITKANGTAEMTLVANWYKACPNSWVASRALLERRFPERWGPSRHGGGAAVALAAPLGLSGLTSSEIDEATAQAMSEAAKRAAEEERQAGRLVVNQSYFGSALPPALTGPVTTHTHRPPSTE